MIHMWTALHRYYSGEGMGWPRLVSDVLSPPVVWGALALPIAFRDAPSQQQALLWAAIYISMVCVLPIVYIGWMVRQGRITDIHMQVREQRLRPFIVSLLCTTAAWWTLRFLGAPSVLPLLTLFTLIQIGLMALITLVWQISMHAMSIAGAAIAAGLLFGVVPGLLVMPLVLLVGAARLKLERHTPAQVIAGAALGVATPLLMFGMMAA